MWAQLAEGKIAFVASDHSPSPPEMKTSKDAFAVWGGIAGVQSTLAILLSHEPELQLDAIAKLTATNVADRFDLSGKGAIEIGMDADLAIVDLAGTYTLTREMLHDRHKLSPYVGRSFRGVVRRTMVRGNTVFLDGKPVDTGFRGRLVGPAGGGAA
jgi:allantoinase